jgi:hypothetical protein
VSATAGPVAPESSDQTIDAQRPNLLGLSIAEVLSDGSPRDVVSISSQLQDRTSSFSGIDQVREACERLVMDGKLERLGQGEFYAQYRLRTIVLPQAAS